MVGYFLLTPTQSQLTTLNKRGYYLCYMLDINIPVFQKFGIVLFKRVVAFGATGDNILYASPLKLVLVSLSQSQESLGVSHQQQVASTAAFVRKKGKGYMGAV